MQKIQLKIKAREWSASSQEVKKISDEIKVLDGELNRLSSKSTDEFFVGLSEIPEKGMRYLNKKRDLEILEKTYLLLYQQYKQAEFQSKKNVPILKIVDYPSKPEYKFRPKRTIVIITIVFIETFLFISLLAVLQAWKRQSATNSKLRRVIDAWLSSGR
jgi:capsule polysaccharide export protein KpsE/RkpR